MSMDNECRQLVPEYIHDQVEKWLKENISLNLDKKELMNITMTHFKGCINPKMVYEVILKLKGSNC